MGKGEAPLRETVALPNLLGGYLLEKPVVYHVGTLDPANKRPGSLEGSGLSVSEFPEEWRSIARLGGAPQWELTRVGGCFVDALAALDDAAVRDAVIDWARRKRYLRLGRLWELRWTDYEDSEVSMRYRTHLEAVQDRTALLEERWEWAPDATANEFSLTLLCRVAIATPQMMSRAQLIQPPLFSASDHALAFYVEDLLPDVDGLWWNEDLVPLEYSAPRGVIFKDRVERWAAE